jgi:LmbE family N-acetylglucosaminyl deacetylase
MRWIYLSPHLDDGVLSCGSLIWEQVRLGMSVEIWTVFAGIPRVGPISKFAHLTHLMWGTGDAKQTVHQRREEDRQAAGILGVKTAYFNFLDCIYRRSYDGSFLYPRSVTTEIVPEDRPLVKEIADLLTRRLRRDDVVVCPLAIGGHVDHVLVRRAAETLGLPLVYYADIPYVLNTPAALEPALSGFEVQVHPLSEEGVDAWLRAVVEYRSQLSSLFSGRGTLDDAMRLWVKNHGGIPLWRGSRGSS